MPFSLREVSRPSVSPELFKNPSVTKSTVLSPKPFTLSAISSTLFKISGSLYGKNGAASLNPV